MLPGTAGMPALPPRRRAGIMGDMAASRDSMVILGRTNFRNSGKLFGMRTEDRLAHLYMIGKTGTGKSTLMENLIQQDIAAGRGVALLDPHGDLVERVLAAVPAHRRAEVIYFNVPDAESPMGFNPLERVAPAKRALAASGLLDAFKKIWAEFWGPRTEHILRHALLALLDQSEATLADIVRLFDDKTFRKHVAEGVANSHVRRFWLKEFEGYPARFRAEAVAPIQNKAGAFLAHPVLQRILTQPKSSFDLRRVMDGGRIFLVNLAKGKIGEDAAALLGAMLVSSIGVAALSRADRPESERREFFLYLDEFHTFTTLSLAEMLAQLRKYRVGLVMAHQYLAQLDEKLKDAIFGNAGTVIAFRLGAPDAKFLAQDFGPEAGVEDLVSLPAHSIYLRLMVNGTVARPFSADTILLKNLN
jgi:type IV secretory pathway TraG/TraD family ATPase VirD4